MKGEGEGEGLPVLFIKAGKEPGEEDFMSVLHWNNWRRGEREEGGEEEEENRRGREGRGG